MPPDHSVAGAVGVSARELRHTYDTEEGTITVLDGVVLDIAPADFVAITGASGAGKTTLLSLIGGLERIQHGTIKVGDVDLGSLSGDALAAYRRATIGFVFQDYGLLGTLTALENVELALTFAGLPLGKRRSRARDLLDAVGLASRASHRPAALSGGESQRVAIARALANSPRLVLADEPTGNLDETSAERVLALLQTLPAEHGCTVLVVTHNALIARRCDRELRLDDGHVARP